MFPMLVCVSVLVILQVTMFCIVSCNNVSADNRVVEVCQLETMKGRCRWNSEVMVVTSARWGRMKTGRCLEVHPSFMATHGQDPLFLGCSDNVLAMLDKRCSGRSECDIRIPDPDLDNIKPCYPDLKYYLEMSYTCVPVVADSRSCTVVVTDQNKFIMSSSTTPSNVSLMSSCGSRLHPWQLEAPIGQRIDISLLDFTGPVNTHLGRDGNCHQYGYIVEKTDRNNVSICSSGRSNEATFPREKAVFLSKTNSAFITLVTGTEENKPNFLIQVTAIGCTNMIPPDNAWLKRSNNDVIIGCYLSQQTWQLKCDGHEWKGQVGTCPDTYVGEVHQADEKKIEFRVTGTMIAIATVAVIICSLVIVVGCYCFRRYRYVTKDKQLETSTQFHQILPKTADNDLHNIHNTTFQT